MKIAIPIHGNRVMPRFGCTRECIVATVEDDRVLATERLTVTTRDIRSLFTAKRVSVLICGGIHPRFQHFLQGDKIDIIWGVVGNWQDVLQAYLNGTLQHDRVFCARKRGGERCHFRRGHQGGDSNASI
jgi:predicted Fe-Mo cluster-binding NifX family protein